MEVFSLKNKYFILCSLFRQEALFCKGIINLLDSEKIDYKFSGAIPFFNPALVPWASQYFSVFENNPNVLLHDTNKFMNELKSKNGDILFSDAVKICDDQLISSISDFYRMV